MIIPVFNEEEAIPIFYNKFRLFHKEHLNEHVIQFIFVDDGSSDNTLEVLQNLALVDEDIKVIVFSRNFGKEAALFAGLEFSEGDVTIPIDVDLQDPIEIIPEMIEKHLNGAEVVLAQRIDRSSDSFLKKKTAEYFYKIHNRISDVQIKPNVGDYRLLSKKVIKEILRLQENQLFMKGIFNWVGFKTEIVEYKREERSAGTTKFNGWKLWNLAVEGFTSFSLLPLKVWTYLGTIIAMIAFIFGVKVIIEKLFFGVEVSGYPSLMVAILFLGGIQLIGIGILGEYLGRNYMETKRRPKYIIDKVIKHKKID